VVMGPAFAGTTILEHDSEKWIPGYYVITSFISSSEEHAPASVSKDGAPETVLEASWFSRRCEASSGPTR
jgi:hypothetical protein